jgi:alpha-L-fucosidase
MSITRRTALHWLAAGSALPLLQSSLATQPSQLIGSEPYQPQWDSLQLHPCPDWYRDAKFGIYFHWGLFSVPAFGNEWYSHWMYQPGRPEYEHHLATYGPLDKFGYKDFAAAFTAEHWDPDAWVALFKDAGARYIGPVTAFQCGTAASIVGTRLAWDRAATSLGRWSAPSASRD